MRWEKSNKPVNRLTHGLCWGYKPRRRPTLPHSCLCSTIGAGELNDRVRDGIGCDLPAIATRKWLGLFITYESQVTRSLTLSAQVPSESGGRDGMFEREAQSRSVQLCYGD